RSRRRGAGRRRRKHWGWWCCSCRFPLACPSWSRAGTELNVGRGPADVSQSAELLQNVSESRRSGVGRRGGGGLSYATASRPGSGTLRAMFKDVSLSAVVAGFIAVLVGITSSIAIVFQAAQALGATPAQTTSWVWALGVGMAVTSI